MQLPESDSPRRQKDSSPGGLIDGYSWAERDAVVRMEAKRQCRPCAKPGRNVVHDLSGVKEKGGREGWPKIDRIDLRLNASVEMEAWNRRSLVALRLSVVYWYTVSL